jgi:hypothetical protein
MAKQAINFWRAFSFIAGWLAGIVVARKPTERERKAGRVQKWKHKIAWPEK